MRKKLLSLLLSAAMLCSLIVIPAAAEEPAGNWYDEAMTVWSERGVLRGDANGNLNPTASITRAELAVMMDRIMVYQTVAENTFADVENGTWYTDAVLKANAAGVLQGSGAYARPLDTITRQEVMVLMARVLDLDGKPDAVASFADAGQVASWARDAVGAMVAAGYVSGSNGNIMPTANITRAEVAVMMDNIFGAVYAQAGTYTEDVDASVVINTDQVVLKDMTISGDLIVAEGVGNGEVTLDNVVVKGRIIVRGGDVITIQGSSTVNTIVAERRDDPTEISLEDKTSVDTVVVPEGSADNTVIDVNDDAQVDSIIIGADNTDLNVSGKVRSVEVGNSANGTTVTAESGAKIDSVTTSGADTTVEGKGTVSNVEAAEGSTDVTVTTPGTKVENNSSEPVTTGKGTIDAGETGTTSSSSGSSSSGGSSGGGTPSHTHSYVYTDNGNGTHTGVCSGDSTHTVTEDHDTAGAGGTCSKCGAAQKETSTVSVKDSEGNIVYADTLKEAIDAAADGSTITLLSDVEYTEGNINVARDLVLDLNGHAVTSTATFEFGRNNSYGNVPVEVTVKNGTWNIKGTSGRLRFENGCTGTFEDMTFRSVDTSLAQALQVSADVKDSKNVYTFTDCTFENTYLAFEGNSGKSYDYDIDITGCTFKDMVLGNGGTCVALDDYIYGTADITDSTFTYTAKGNAVSAIRCDGYPSYLGENKMAVTLDEVTCTVIWFKKSSTAPVPILVSYSDVTKLTVNENCTFTRDGYAIPYNSIVCEYSSNGGTSWQTRSTLTGVTSGTIRLIWDNDGAGYGESFTLPVGVTFDTNGLKYTGTVSAPSNGMIIYDEAEGTYTCVKSSTVIDEASLTSALNDASVSAIKLGASFEVTAQISVDRAVVIDGNNKTISVADDTTWSTVNGYKHLLNVVADGVTIKNLTLDSNGKAYGLQGYTAASIVLENVTTMNSKGAGLTVNGSTVTATGLHTAGNAWGGVNVDKGDGVTEETKFTFDATSTFGEPSEENPRSAVYAETTEVTVEAPDGWAATTVSGYTVWAKLFDGGDGTAANPYQIATAQELYNVGLLTNADNHFKLMNSINMDDVAPSTADRYGDQGDLYWLYGELDGNGKTITSTKDTAGTILYAKNATIKNVTFNVKGHPAVTNATNTTFDNVAVTGTMEVRNNCGAFVTYAEPVGGEVTLTFNRCTADVAISGGGTATNYNAVFVGYAYGSSNRTNLTFNNCVNEGSLVCGKAAMFLGNNSANQGIVTITVNNCVNNGEMVVV